MHEHFKEGVRHATRISTLTEIGNLEGWIEDSAADALGNFSGIKDRSVTKIK